MLFKGRKSNETPHKPVKHIQRKRTKMEWKAQPLLKWQPAAGEGDWGVEGWRFMVMLVQMETHSWLTTSNWKLTFRSTWKDFIRYWEVQHVREKWKKKCVRSSILMEMILRYQFSGRNDACFIEEIVPGSNGCLSGNLTPRLQLWQSMTYGLSFPMTVRTETLQIMSLTKGQEVWKNFWYNSIMIYSSVPWIKNKTLWINCDFLL